jgi:hypothetical protein
VFAPAASVRFAAPAPPLTVALLLEVVIVPYRLLKPARPPML